MEDYRYLIIDCNNGNIEVLSNYIKSIYDLNENKKIRLVKEKLGILHKNLDELTSSEYEDFVELLFKDEKGNDEYFEDKELYFIDNYLEYIRDNVSTGYFDVVEANAKRLVEFGKKYPEVMAEIKDYMFGRII